MQRGQPRLPIGQDRHRIQPLTTRYRRITRNNGKVGSGSPSTDAARPNVRDSSSSVWIGGGARWNTRETADHSSNTRATDRARHGAKRSTTDGTDLFSTHERAAVQLYHLTVIFHHLTVHPAPQPATSGDDATARPAEARVPHRLTRPCRASGTRLRKG